MNRKANGFFQYFRIFPRIFTENHGMQVRGIFNSHPSHFNIPCNIEGFIKLSSHTPAHIKTVRTRNLRQ